MQRSQLQTSYTQSWKSDWSDAPGFALMVTVVPAVFGLECSAGSDKPGRKELHLSGRQEGVLQPAHGAIFLTPQRRSDPAAG
jgi:hypothetical protein